MIPALDNLVVMSTSLLAYLSFATIGNVFVGALVAFFMGRANLGGTLLLMCPVAAIAGWIAPGSVWWVLMNARDTNIDERFLPIIVLPVIFGFYGIFVAIWFTPFRIAQRTNNIYKWLILAATFFAWVPLVWPLQLYAAVRHEKAVERQKSIDAAQAEASVAENSAPVADAESSSATQIESPTIETSTNQSSPDQTSAVSTEQLKASDSTATT